MRYSWDISSCNQTWPQHPLAIVRGFFPSENHGFLTFPWNRSDSTRNETENGRIGGLTPQFMAIQNGRKYGENHGISDFFSQHDSWECLQNGTQTWFLLLQRK